MTLRVLLFLMVLGLPMSAMAKDGLSTAVSKNYLEDYRAYQRMNRDKLLIHPERQENSLRAVVMINWYQERIEDRLRWVEKQDWTRDYKDMFVRAVEWRRESFNGGAEKLFQLSRKYLGKANADSFGYQLLSGELLYRAVLAGHAEAALVYKHHPYQSVPQKYHVSQRADDYQGALKHHENAIDDLILNYLLATVFDDDLVKGYYWLLRRPNLTHSKTVWTKLQKPLSLLSEAERQLAESWVRSGHVPPM